MKFENRKKRVNSVGPIPTQGYNAAAWWAVMAARLKQPRGLAQLARPTTKADLASRCQAVRRARA
jgi:hypothetical protein